jgi:hypothetical protein
MALSKEFTDAVQSGRSTLVRIMLKDSLLFDPTAAQFNEMEKYASDKMHDLFDEHNGEVLNYETSSWDEEYLNKQMVIVVNNFSKERINLLKQMVRKLYVKESKSLEKENVNAQKGKSCPINYIGGGLIGAGAVSAIVGICTSQTAITVCGSVAAAAGVIAIVCKRGKK